jgi:hypothetical protein
VRTVNRYPIMQGPNFGRAFIVICRLMCLLVGLVFAAPVVLGGEPGKANDPRDIFGVRDLILSLVEMIREWICYPNAPSTIFSLSR